MKDLFPLAEKAAGLLRNRHETIAVAESSAGGLISAALLAVPGASAYFLGGTVVYTYKARDLFLDIPHAALEGIRPATEAYALLLARTVCGRLSASWGLAETGATGPAGNRYGDPAGHGCIALAGATEHALTLNTNSADRQANMRAFAGAALDLLIRALNG